MNTQTADNQTDIKENYIIPTKERPVFTAECDWFGFIEGIYKYHIVERGTDGSCGGTFALYYADAINKLHEWIRENPETLKDFPKCKFTIRLIDGTWNEKLSQKKERKVYTISAKDAKVWLF